MRIADEHLAVGGRYLATMSILGDPIHEWMTVDSALVSDAITHGLDRFRDQTFTLVHAVSFDVMKRERVTHAFSFDHHFRVARFALLD